MSGETKARKTKRTKKPGGVLQALRARTQSATIHLTAEEDWQTEVPNIRLSRVFAIVLILHVVAVGGILAFQMMSPEAGDLADGLNPTPTALQVTPPDPRIEDDVPERVTLTGSEVEGLTHYRVLSGDTLISIARRFNVSVAQLERINKLDQGQPIFPGKILFLPDGRAGMSTPEEARDLLVGVDGVPRGPLGTISPAVPPKPAIKKGGGDVRPGGSKLDPPRLPVVTDLIPVKEALPAIPVEKAKRPPSGAIDAPAADPRGIEAKVAGTVRIYTVQKGETAWRLGRKFGIAPDKLLKINGITDARQLRAGQKIKIPSQD